MNSVLKQLPIILCLELGLSIANQRVLCSYLATVHTHICVDLTISLADRAFLYTVTALSLFLY